MSGTVPADTLVIPVGPRGRQGVQGATGPVGRDGVFPAPTDAALNGRQVQPAPARWTAAYPLTAGTLEGGLTLCDQVYPTLPNFDADLRRGLDLVDGAWGLAPNRNSTLGRSGGQISLRSPDIHQFWSRGAPTFSIRGTELWFSQDGWRIAANPASGDMIYYSWNNTPLFGFQGSTSPAQFTVWGDLYIVNEMYIAGSGVGYHNIGNTRFLFWYSPAVGYFQANMDRAIGYAFASACDERLKQDIAPSEYDCLGAIRQVPLYQFRWQDYTDPSNPRPAARGAPVVPIGFVAQRLAEQAPDLVARAPRTIREVEGPSDLPVSDVAPAMWGVEANAMLATLVGAVQQLDKMLTAKEQARAGLPKQPDPA